MGKRILHDFIEDDAVVQYTGTVLSQVPGFPEWYNTVYDDEPDCVYTFQLLDDYNRGDLKYFKATLSPLNYCVCMLSFSLVLLTFYVKL